VMLRLFTRDISHHVTTLGSSPSRKLFKTMSCGTS
jgi:hypothetical protein